MKIRVPFLFPFLLFFAVIFLVGCKKESTDTGVTPIELSATESKYAPFQIMEIDATSPIFTMDSLQASIENIELKMVTDDYKAFVLLPKLANGNHELRFQIGTQFYVVNFLMEALTNIANPDTYIQVANQEINSNITFLNNQRDSLLSAGVLSSELDALTQDLTRYSQQMQQQTAAYNQLTAAEKADFAAFMAANQALMDSLKILSTPLASSIDVLRSTQQVDDYESSVNTSEIKFVKQVIRTVSLIPLLQTCFQLVAVPNPIFSAGATIAAVIITTDFILEVDKTAIMGKRLVLKRIKPFFIKNPEVNSFLNDQETSVNVKADYRNIISSDPNGRVQNNENGPVIQRISDYYNSFKSAYVRFVNLLPSFMRPSLVIAQLPTNPNILSRSVFSNYIQISNCSNPNITLTQSNQADGSIKLKATTTLTGTQSFSYDIEYLNADFTTNLKKTVNATVVNGSSCPGALGSYWVKNFFIANPGSYESAEMILLPDGVMKYKLVTESTYRTYTYTLAGCTVLIDLFGCTNGFTYVNGTTNYSFSNTCSPTYRSHAFFKQ